MEIGTLVEELISKTQAKRLAWEPTARLDEFAASFRGKYSITVSRLQDQYGEFNYKVVLRDERDREMIAVDSEYGLPEPLQSKHLYTLFEEARSSALKVEESLSEIINDLKSL